MPQLAKENLRAAFAHWPQHPAEPEKIMPGAWEVDAFASTTARIRGERDLALTQLHDAKFRLSVVENDNARLEAERDDYARRLELTDKAWSIVAAERDAARDECQILRDQLTKFTAAIPKPAPEKEPAFLKALRSGNRERVGVVDPGERS